MLAEFARRSGIQPRTALRLVQSVNGSLRRIACGKAHRIIVDSEECRPVVQRGPC
jgi:hypothetical protein